MIFGKKDAEKDARSGTNAIIRIATASIAIGIAVMIIAVAIVTGFQNEIRSKVIGFGSHIQITNFDSNNSFEVSPIDKNQHFYPHLDTVPEIRHIQIYATKAGIIKTKEDIHGIILKGISSDFDWSFFQKNIIKGNTFKVTDTASTKEVVISKYISDKLKLEIGDKMITYFIQDPPRARDFTVTGIYDTGLEKFDQNFVIADIQHIQKLNNWSPNQISGFEVLLEKYRGLKKMDEFIYEHIGFQFNSKKITDTYRDIFGWLELQDWNVMIIIGLMLLVAGINMISALLVLILDRINMIGILKAMGAQNWSIRKIFLYNAAYLIGVGLIWGNVIGIVLCLIQLKFQVITLPKETYYVSHVPINFSILNILLLNAGSMVLCLLMLVLPSYIVTKISPVKAIRFN